ncbi:MAG: T9SS type A sorting domain-containing protein [candidate division WOR-3 bacterium]|nr:T9SS type A sorting domain-containing protein [candidate division WOR-3 bacterium]
MAKDAGPGTGVFDYADGAPVLGICQWAPISVGQDGQINILPITAAYALSYSHIAAGDWPNFSTPITDFPSPGWCTHDITASKVSSKVAVTWSTNAVTVGLEQAYADFSTDGGANWGGATLVELPAAYGGDTVTSCHLSSLSPSYDAQDRFHIVANLMPMLNDTGFVLPSQIWHYCPDNSPAWSRIAVASVDPANYTTSIGYNATLACRPSMGQDDEGNLFVAWEQFDTANVEPITSRLRADIFAARSTDNGATWGEALKLTDAGTNSMRFPSVIDLAIEGDPDTLCVIYEIDQIAGFFVQSEGAATSNAVVVQKVSIDLLPMAPYAVAEQKGATPLRLDAVAKPNPSGGRTMISYALPQTSDVSLIVYDAVGRPVQTLASGRHAAGRYSATWNAGNAAAGVYFYTLASGKTSVTRKLILTH